MCGIFGCILKNNNNDIVNTIVKGLQKLLYRGYDSWGFVLDNIKIKRSLDTLEYMYLLNEYKGKIGIGHTRWATHGKPSIQNTHPIQSADIAWFVVHNGILQNHTFLMEKFELKHTTETDSEIFVSLAEKIYSENMNLSFVEVIKKVLKYIEGSYAILITSIHFPGEMIAACNGSPLILANTETGIFIASDHMAITDLAKSFIQLDKCDFVHIKECNYTLDSAFLKNKELQYIYDVPYDKKLGYEHYMMKEIMEQPKSLKELFKGRVYSDYVKLGGLLNYKEEFSNATNWTFLACGSSYNACLAVRPLIEKHFQCEKKIDCELASEFVNRTAKIIKDGIYIIVSQSGETKDCLRAAEFITHRSGKCFGINNRPGCVLDHSTIAGIHLNIGAEISVAATKSFTATVVAIMMICNMIIPRNVEMLLTLPSIIENHIEKIKNDTILDKLAHELLNGSWWSIGDGYGYGIAREVGLKLQEVAYIPVFTITGSEIKHGPLALIDTNSKFVYFGKIKNDIESILTSREASVFSIPFPTNCDTLTEIICQTISYQLLTYHVAKLKNLPIDRPRNLAKSVTV
jgi:glucosamine--fructose-6-phosphate aminotransferase (isomerizing)